MKRTVLLIFTIIFTLFSAKSQIFVDNQGNIYDQREKQSGSQTQQVANQNRTASWFDKNRLEFGGNIGLQFGNYTFVNISPQIGYRFSNYFSAGAGIGYSYFNYDNYTEHFAGFNLYGNIYPVDFLILSVKPEISRMWMSYEIERQKYSDQRFVPSVVVGGGVRLGNLTVQLKYDVVQDEYSPYGNRLFYSVGYMFGF